MVLVMPGQVDPFRGTQYQVTESFQDQPKIRIMGGSAHVAECKAASEGWSLQASGKTVCEKKGFVNSVGDGGHGIVRPITMETLQDLGKEYQQRFAALAPYRDSVWRILVRDFFQRYVDPSATVLDLGSGWGEFIRHIRACRRIAMDLNPDMPSRVGAGVETILQDCSQTWQVLDASLDIVFTSNFFEHLPDKDALRRTLQEARRCLKDGGRIICLGPNIRFLHGAYWDFWDHFLPLTDRSMVEILTLTGFAVERVEPRFLPYSMSQGFTPPIGFISLYIRIPLLWRIFGKQFLLVGRKQIEA
jgi:SAM-dependent methyltransferase